jgi:hypothetical protein
MTCHRTSSKFEFFFSQISWPLGSLVSDADYELKDPETERKTSGTHTEVSVERKPEDFPKFRAKMNYCVHNGASCYFLVRI